MARERRRADEVVGRNIRLFRLQRGMSQTALGARLGVTFQQIQKYEMATNRVSAARLAQLAEALGMPVSALFDGVAAGDEAKASAASKLLMDPIALRLLQAFDQIQSTKLRDAVLRLIDLLASGRVQPGGMNGRHRG